MWRLWNVVIVLVQSLSMLVSSKAHHPRTTTILPPSSMRRTTTPLLLSALRGAATPGGKGTKKKKRLSKKKKTSLKEKEVIQKAMKEKDAADVLGDSIRERAETLRSDGPALANTATITNDDDPFVQQIDQSLSSLGYAMGTSDYYHSQQVDDDKDGGGVEAAPTSVLANYFLKSHGGAHALQSACSFLAVGLGLGAVLVPTSSKNPSLEMILMKRCLQATIVKHLSGLLAATAVAAKSISEIGFTQARSWMEQLAIDPVSQYVFYASCILVWLSTVGSTTTGTIWWKTFPHVSLLLVGPILLREWISTAFVVSDVLVLLCTTTTGNNDSSGGPTRLLQAGRSLVNAGMSVLVTPSVWRNASAANRQRVLAKLTSRISLVMEVVVGLLLAIDGMLAVWQFTVAQPRPKITTTMTRIMCARLYLNFLWVRRKRIQKVALKIRGGAADIPSRILEVLLHPKESMGISAATRGKSIKSSPGRGAASSEKATAARVNQVTWMDYVNMVLGMDEK